jgi:predicted ArsR family transcriptional regulator
VLEVFGKTQKELLKEMFKSQSGLTVDELTDRLGVTRTAVHQHLSILKSDGFVIEGALQATAGRPGRRFLLTQKGQDVFPKQYSWFSAIMLSSLKSAQGSDHLTTFMRSAAKLVAQGLTSKDEKKSYAQQVQSLIATMNELAYDAKLKSVGRGFEIEARNCVYHSLAKEHPEVCEFDIELIKSATGSTVEHKECMVRGASRCCFRLERAKK